MGIFAHEVDDLSNLEKQCDQALADYKDFITRANLKWFWAGPANPFLVWDVLSIWTPGVPICAVSVPDGPCCRGEQGIKGVV